MRALPELLNISTATGLWRSCGKITPSPDFQGTSCRTYWIIPFIWVKLLMADGEPKRGKVQEMRCTWSSSRSSLFTMVSMKPSFPKKIGIWHRKSARSIPLSGKRSTIQTTHTSCPVSWNAHAAERVCTAILPRLIARTRKHGIITTAKIRLRRRDMSAASGWISSRQKSTNLWRRSSPLWSAIPDL